MSAPSLFVEFFGPSLWKSMHSIAFNYGTDPFHPTPDEQKAAIDFFGSLVYLIPCAKCRGHYKKYISEHPIDADSRDSLSKWVYDLHSDVNRRRHVKNISYEEVKNDYAGWSREKMEKYLSMPPQKRLRKLADPHFGRRIQGQGTTKESALGFMDDIGMDKIMALVIGGAVIGGLIYYSNRKNQEEEENKKSN